MTREQLDADDAKITALDLRAEDARAPAFSDEALALRFADLHADELRYVAAWGKWLTFDGTVWQFDDTLAAYSLARKVAAPPLVNATNRKSHQRWRAPRRSPPSPTWRVLIDA